jgi:hypothetical protein
MDFRAVAFVSDFIHQRIDQINPAAVVGEDVLLIGGGGDFCGVKAIPGIAYYD